MFTFVKNTNMPNKENLIKDYEWVVRVVKSCKTGKQLDGAMNIYDLWLRKHSKLSDKDGLYVLEYSRKIYSEIIKKFDLYEKQSV
jgi:hypothetical protein